MEFTDVRPGWFTYAAWSLGSPRLGPFVRSSAERDGALRRLEVLAGQLEADQVAEHVRVFAATFIAPLSGGPRYDVTLLARGERPLGDELADRVQWAKLPQPTLVQAARNVRRFGDTEAGDGNILFNHFAGDASQPDAVTPWQTASQWYADVARVDNSTLLQFEPGGPFLVMNYVRIPGGVPAFMAAQLLRPSFYRDVLGTLRGAGLRAFPIFACRVTS